MGDHFNVMDTRLDAMDTRFDGMDTRITRLKDDMSFIRRCFDPLANSYFMFYFLSFICISALYFGIYYFSTLIMLVLDVYPYVLCVFCVICFSLQYAFTLIM